MKVSSCDGGGVNSNQSNPTQRIRRQKQLQLLPVAVCAVAGLMSKSAVAASGTWTGAIDTNWADANWTATPVPGIGDTATFNGAGNGNTTINLGAGINVSNIVFSSPSAAAYIIGSGPVGSQTLSLNASGGIIINAAVINNEVFDSTVVLGTNATAQNYTFTNNSLSSTLDFASNIVGGPAGGTAGTQTLTVTGAGNTVIGGSLLNGGAGQTVALAKTGSGTLTFNGATNAAIIGGGAGGGAYGTVTVNSGSLVLDYSNFNAVGNANLLNSYTPVTLGGGTLQMIGNATNASTQSFNNGSGVTVNPGVNTISVGPNAGNTANPLPTLNLGAFTQNVGSQTVFNGPAYYNSASGATAVTVPATGTITTSTLGNQNNLLWPTTRAGIATVGLYNWASVVTAPAGTNNVLSGDQVSGFYAQVAAGGTAAAADTNYDLLGNASASNTTTWYADTMRFNVPGAFTFTTNPAGNGHIALVSGILVTPNVGANNTTIANGGAYLASADSTAGNCPIDVYQNNTAGELLINVPLYYYSSASRATCFVKGGAGTAVLSGSGTSSGNTGASYLNGGCTVINNDAQIGAVGTAAMLYLNGGTLVSSGTMTLGNGATASPRPITLLGNGGGLAAVTGTTLTVDGVIGSAATAGTLVIGIPASSANGNVAGLLPGTGTGTANTTPVYGTGTVALTYANNAAGNYQYSPTLITGGATLQINSQYDLGGADASSTTFNGGTLQYSTTLATGTAGTVTDISAQPVIFSGNATIDTNGHPITYANSIGGGGSGLLTVMSTATGGSLTLAAANNYTGGTNVSSGTLNVTNTTGSATGTGPVNLLGGTLAGNGIILGTVNVSGGAIAPGAAGTTLNLGALNFTSGSFNFSVNGSAGTASLISTASTTFNGTPTFGAISIAGSGGIYSGETFTVLSSATPISGGGYLSGLSGQTVGRFTFTPSESANDQSIVLTVSGNPANLIWAGGVAGLGTGIAPQGDGSTWNSTQTTSPAASNWNHSGSYDYFYNLDNVTFNDAGLPNDLVNITTSVAPSSLTVTTGTAGRAYTFVGTGSITGSGIVSVTAGTLNLENSGTNIWSGGTSISAGASLVTAVANVLPASGNVTLAGTLDLSGYNQSIGGLADGGVSTGIVQSTGGSAILTTTGSGTFSGKLQNGTGTLGLTVGGTGTQILTGSNTYTGPTTINAGATLQIGNNTAVVSLPSGQGVTDNGNLAFNFSTGTTAVSNIISGIGTVTQSGPAGSILQLNALNTYSGGTIIKSGIVQFTSATGTGTGDVTIAAGSLLDLNGNSPVLGALNGAGTVDSSTAGTMVLTLGNNNDSGTFSGSIKNTNGAVSLVKAGTGTQTLSGSSAYAGTTTLNAGTLSISGTLGTSTASTGAIYVNTATLAISGNVYAPSLSTYNTAGFAGVNMTAGSVTLSGNLGVNQDTNGSGNSGLVSLTGGTLSANSVTIDRSSSNYGGTVQLVGSAGTGLYVNGATLTIATTLTFGDLGSRSFSSADMRIDSGSVTVGGTTIITDNNTRLSLLDVNGGTFTSNDTTGAGIQVGGLYPTGYGELLVSGTGIVNTHTITLGDANQTAGLNILELIGGTTYVGSGGIVAGAGSATNTINLGSTAVATTPIIAASANWSSSLNITLNNSSTGSQAIFQAANASGAAENITLTGTLFGAGGLTKTGKGYLALAGGTSYLGPTTVSSGALVDVNNSVVQYSSSVNINGSLIIQSSPSLQSITNAVAQGYNGGAWNGSGAGVISSSAAAADTNHLHALGVIQNDNGTGTQLYSTFEGYSSLNDSDVLVKYTYYGDTDLNGEVDGSDYSRIDYAYAYNQTAASPLTGWFNGDFNYDGVIDGSDYALMDNAFNQQGAQISAQIASQIGGSSAVPEPATLGLLGMGAVGLLGRRRRRMFGRD